MDDVSSETSLAIQHEVQIHRVVSEKKKVIFKGTALIVSVVVSAILTLRNRIRSSF